MTGIVITACLPIHKNDEIFEGVACADMLMRDLIDDLPTFSNLDVGYTFMLDSAGNALHCIFSLLFLLINILRILK